MPDFFRVKYYYTLLFILCSVSLLAAALDKPQHELADKPIDQPLLLAGFGGGGALPGLTNQTRERSIRNTELTASNTALSANYGYTPIHIAANSDNIVTMKILLHNGANINARSLNGETVLHIAAANGYIELVAHLLEAGVLPELRDKNNKRAIDRAADTGQVDTVKLLTNPAGTASSPSSDSHPLHHAAQNGDLAALKRQLAHSDVNHRHGEYQWTALHMAAIGGSAKIIKLLLEHGADPQAVELEYQRTALHLAAMLGNINAVELLAPVTKLNSKDSQNETALQMASANDHLPVVQTLVKTGANINEQTEYGDTALTLAINAGHTAIARWLLQQGARLSNAEDSEILHNAIRYGQSELLPQLIKKGARQLLNNINEDGEAPLHIAAMLGDIKASAALLNAGADINIRSDDILGGQTALHIAVFHDHQEVAQQLLQQGMDINIRQSENDKTALHLAASHAKLSHMAQLLVARGADINAISRDPDIIVGELNLVDLSLTE